MQIVAIDDSVPARVGKREPTRVVLEGDAGCSPEDAHFELGTGPEPAYLNPGVKGTGPKNRQQPGACPLST